MFAPYIPHHALLATDPLVDKTLRAARRAQTRPVVLSDATSDMDVSRADLFAPLLSISVVDSLDEALELDDACPYALGASVFGPREKTAAWTDRIRAGIVVVNDLITPTADPRVPFGGWHESGYGVTRGAEGLLELTRPRVVLERRGNWRPHYQKLMQGDERMFAALIEAKHARSCWQRLRGWFRLGKAAAQRSRSGEEMNRRKI